MNEAETRAEHIDPALAAAGWGVVDGSKISREFPITPGRIEGLGRRGNPCSTSEACSYSVAAPEGEIVVGAAGYQPVTVHYVSESDACGYPGNQSVRITLVPENSTTPPPRLGRSARAAAANRMASETTSSTSASKKAPTMVLVPGSRRGRRLLPLPLTYLAARYPADSGRGPGRRRTRARAACHGLRAQCACALASGLRCVDSEPARG
jgi:hypothetical protein